MAPQDSAGGDDDERLLPPGPDPGQRDPEEAVRHTKLGSRRGSLVDGELVAQGEILESELPMAAAQEGEEPNEVEQDGDHRARILSGSELGINHLPAGRSFGEGQATQLGHTNAEMVYRRYHRFIPNLRGRDGALAAKKLADEGL